MKWTCHNFLYSSSSFGKTWSIQFCLALDYKRHWIAVGTYIPKLIMKLSVYVHGMCERRITKKATISSLITAKHLKFFFFYEWPQYTHMTSPWAPSHACHCTLKNTTKTHTSELACLIKMCRNKYFPTIALESVVEEFNECFW